MIEALFLALWSLLFLGIGLLCLTVIKHHIKVYLLIGINCLYLSGIFVLFPYIRIWFDLP
jgi:hypothetical protein